MTKFIFVTGGVVSGIGKGIVAASVGNILTNFGYSVTALKCDPYINVDPGTMNPMEHGEVFVTVDGAETDLDLGHYERFIGVHLNKDSCITTGQIYKQVIDKERSGGYNGGTVQIMHIADAIKSHIYSLASSSSVDYLIVEIGGTIGDLESLPFVEAMRQLRAESDKGDTCSIHCSYVPYLRCVGEFKTKPTQHSVRELQGLGVSPDIIVTRAEDDLSPDTLSKVARYCYLPESHVIDCPDATSIYDVPAKLRKNGITQALRSILNFSSDTFDATWETLIKHSHRIGRPNEIYILLVGKYTELKDSYISVIEALNHAANEVDAILYIDTYDATKPTDVEELIGDFGYDGFIIPGGFGDRGVETMISILTGLRQDKIPTLGICLGMQMMCIEYSRTVLGHDEAASTEFEEYSDYPIIDLLPEQKHGVSGGTLRLGSQCGKTYPNTIAREAYGEEYYWERHRHRYEVNNDLRGDLINGGMITSGTSKDSRLVEIVELPRDVHPFYLGCQFHPEFESTITNPHPLFKAFLKSCL